MSLSEQIEAAGQAAAEQMQGIQANIPMDYLERHPGDLVAAMREYAEDRWKLIDRLKAAAERERELVEALRLQIKNGSESLPAPCSICEYNGPGYYQPKSHPCVGNGNYRQALAKYGDEMTVKPEDRDAARS